MTIITNKQDTTEKLDITALIASLFELSDVARNDLMLFIDLLIAHPDVLSKFQTIRTALNNETFTLEQTVRMIMLLTETKR